MPKYRTGADRAPSWRRLTTPLTPDERQELLAHLDRLGELVGAHPQRRKFVRASLTRAFAGDWTHVDTYLRG